MFIITQDFISDDPVDICGPNHITATEVDVLKAIADHTANVYETAQSKAVHFYMYDDDGERYYAGYWVDGGRYRSDELEPLDCFGAPNAGCTSIKVRTSGGEYTTV